MRHRNFHRWAWAGILTISLLSCRAYGPTVLIESVTPSSLAFTSASLTPQMQTVQITNTGVEVLEIQRIALAQVNDISIPESGLLTTDCTGNARTVSTLNWLNAGECAQFVVQYTPQPDEMITNTVLITSDAPGSGLVQVPVTAENSILECPAPSEFVAQIQADSSSGPMTPASLILPGMVSFAGAFTAADPSIAVAYYGWSIISAPPMSDAITFDGANAALNATVSGDYQVGLTLVDTDGCASPQTVFPFTVTVPPCRGITPPTAVLTAFVGGAPLTATGVRAETTVDFNAADSIAGTNPIVSFNWSYASAPPGNPSPIMSTGATATILFVVPGTYVVQVTVTDTVGCQSSQAEVTVIVSPLPTQQCGPSSQFIYNVDINGVLYAFVPSTTTITALGNIGCQPPPEDEATPNTMAVDRQGTAWIEFSDGLLFQVDTTSMPLQCFPASLNQANVSDSGWGSCFAAGGVLGQSDTYFIAEADELASINTTTLAVTTIGQFTSPQGLLIDTEPELSGTADGRLFGLFPGEPWTVDEIDRNSGFALSETPEPAISQGDGAINWAFASWGNDFYFFVGDGNPTTVYRHNALTNTTTAVLSVPAEIVGAGVSPCAQATEGD